MTSTFQFILDSLLFKNVSNDKEFHKGWRITVFIMLMAFTYFIMDILATIFNNYRIINTIEVDYKQCIYHLSKFLVKIYILMLIVSTVIKISKKNLPFLEIFRITVFSCSLFTLSSSFVVPFLDYFFIWNSSKIYQFGSPEFDVIPTLIVTIFTLLLLSFLFIGFLNLRRNINQKNTI